MTMEALFASFLALVFVTVAQWIRLVNSAAQSLKLHLHFSFSIGEAGCIGFVSENA
ncbi:hypothetical protein PF005_g2515 [Phytophthora fragariae]|uniref:Uncharacterized protein n=1 Tax=Phytophthora fragariae TaxID=53985 RepID=A0A6A3F584_9STRA|nr:hypothetical protein PF003_g8272 [Phytophthora fragariae]KAE8940592.1 hypothetical protein PF009_g9599 [Phytophthora fragariae]KAE9015352.1 hypothetical protein PF011_g7656 [Phytophthora fragariae]KAE9118878.1 hypothetical protein PF010_g8063 [Phytophthora fragariae]KAE9132614.1 hypothetical protein PF006_g15240 [Phytophthora fragariae]